ncbi:MAG: RNA polymerase factor sigma-32 [Mariprofundaceae bacterium]
MYTATPEMTSLSLFNQHISRVEKMTREEEMRLAGLWKNQQDRDAARILVEANLPAVAAIAREYRHFGLQEMDLIQEGALGLMHAVKRFDPERGFRLMTYANWWVRAAIHDFVLHSWSIVKLGTNKLQRRVFAGLRHAKEAIAALEGTNREDVAEKYGVSATAYQEASSAYLQRDLSLHSSEGVALIDSLSSNEATPEEAVTASHWQAYQRQQLHAALATLNDRDRMIVESRHLAEEPLTLKNLAETFSISIERVRQLEKKAISRIKKHIII